MASRHKPDLFYEDNTPFVKLYFTPAATGAYYLAKPLTL